MRFSHCFSVARTSDDDWFDPLLSADTPLFLDPFLIYADEYGVFVGAHDEIIAVFNQLFLVLARSKGDVQSVSYRTVVNAIQFGEVSELCLGYSAGSTRGSGSGAGTARVIANAMWEGIQAGLRQITHLEELQLLHEGIGADRISDMTASVLRRRLAQYTFDVCVRRQVPIREVGYRRGHYDPEEERWEPLAVSLPLNPYSGRPVLLVPRRYLRELPTVTPEDFWQDAYTNENETLRLEFGRDVGRRVKKAAIIRVARRYPAVRRRYLQRVEMRPPTPYDFGHDPLGIREPYDGAVEWAALHTLPLSIVEESQFETAIEQMIGNFRHYVEREGGRELLFNDDGSRRREAAAQNLFKGLISAQCQHNDIDIAREASLGSGIVDFKLSRGWSLRTLIEVKRADNTRFWNGLEAQLPSYMEDEQVERGWFLIVAYDQKDLGKLTDLQKRVDQVSARTGKVVSAVVVNASHPEASASKKKSGG